MSLRAQNVELFLTRLAIFFAPMKALHLENLFLTFSDILFMFAIFARSIVGLPVTPFGRATFLWLGGVILLCGGLMLSSNVAGDPGRGVAVTLQYSFALFVLPLVIAGRSVAVTLSLLKTAMWSMVILCLLGIVPYALELRGGEEQFVLVTADWRVASIVDNPNGLALMISLYTPIWALLAFTREFRIHTSLLVVSILLVTLILTSSNSGLMTTMLTFGAFLVVFGRFKTWFTAALGLLAVGLVLYFYGEQILPDRFMNRVAGAWTSGDVHSAGTFSDRMLLIYEAMQFANETWLIGFGADQYRHYSSHELMVHNSYLLIITEGGAVALFGMLIVLSAGLLIATYALVDGRNTAAAAASLAVIFAFALIMMTSTHVYSRFFATPVIVVLAVAAAAAQRRVRVGGLPGLRLRRRRRAVVARPVAGPPKVARNLAPVAAETPDATT